MPFALVVIGLLLVVSGVRNTTGQLSSQVAKDFSGSGNFFYWLTGLIAVGSLGYIDELKTFSRLLLALIIVVMALSNKGFFAKLQNAVSSAQAPAPSTTDQQTGTTVGSTAAAAATNAVSKAGSSLFGIPSMGLALSNPFSMFGNGLDNTIAAGQGIVSSVGAAQANTPTEAGGLVMGGGN